jgi:hypothetical protein
MSVRIAHSPLVLGQRRRGSVERLSGNSQCGSDVASFGGAKRPKWCSLAPFRTLAGPCNGAYSEFPDSLWKGNSPKFVCRILYNPGPMRTLRRIPDVGRHTSRH